MRGGTSKAVFLNADSIPGPGKARDDLIMAVFGSGDPRQIDGLGGADILTSKVAIVGPPSRAGADVDYTFGQVGIAESTIDWSGNCGNISSAVGVYAIEEGLVGAQEPTTNVVVHNTNTGSLLRLILPVKEGLPLVQGDYQISGVPGSGAEIRLDFAGTVGDTTGEMLPTGSARDHLLVRSGLKLEVSLVDVAKLAVFFRSEDIGLNGDEGPEAFTPAVLHTFQKIQEAAARLIDLDPRIGLPRPVAVTAPREFAPLGDTNRIAASDVDLIARWVVVPPPRLHKAFAGTGAVCTGVAARIEGTVVNEVATHECEPLVRIGHPSGVFPVMVEIDGRLLKEASFSRTARRLMEGTAYIR
jgi:2-methylaconitate cis-trans-isomerase PrpF